MAALIALILFVLAAFGVNSDDVNIVYIGFALLALHLIVGNWPFGYFATRRN